MNEDVRYLDIPLAEMQQDLANQTGGFDTIKTTVRSVLSAASLIVSLVGALQLITAHVAPAWLWIYWSGIILAAALYIGLIVVCIISLMPIRVWSPLKPDWDLLTTAYKELGEKDIRLKQLSSILSAIEKNDPLLYMYSRLQMAALILLPIIVAILLLLSLIPRI